MKEDSKEIIEGQFWQLDKEDGYTIKILAIRDKCAMVRRKGCVPFVIYVSELLKKYRLNPQSKKHNQ